MADNEHKNLHNNDAAMHEVKGFPSAAVGYSYRKNIKGFSEWLRDAKLPNVLAQVNGYEAPTTEVDGDFYSVDAPDLDINAILFQSGTTVRFTFTSGYTNIYAVNNYLQITGAAFAAHNGVHVITAVNAAYLEVTIALITSNADDVSSGSVASGYVTHQDYDPENLANGNSIPRQGLVYHDGVADIWYGDAFITGDEFYDINEEAIVRYSGTENRQDSATFSVKISLTAAQILAATKVTVVAAPGAGKGVFPLYAAVVYTHNGVVYDTGQDLVLQIDTAATHLLETPQSGTGMLKNAASTALQFLSPSASLSSQFVANKKLEIFADAGSGAGDGTAEVYITYRIVEL